jgi:acyl-CoA thioesterase FadM
MPSDSYGERFRVRLYETTPAGVFRPSHLIRALEQTTLNMPRPPAAFGAAAISELWLHNLAAAAYGDEVAVTTWISREEAEAWISEYEVRRQDGMILAQARMAWVRTRAAAPSDARLPLGPWPGGPPSVLWSAAGPLLSAEERAVDQPPQTTPHTAYLYEATPAGITAAAAYLDWLTAAAGAALEGETIRPGSAAPPGADLTMRALQIAYPQATRPGDTVTITTLLRQPRPDQLAATQHIHFGGYPASIWAQRSPESATPPAAVVVAQTVYELQAATPRRDPRVVWSVAPAAE